MKVFALASILLAGTILPAAAQTIGGTYTVAGTNIDGSSYEGKAVITLTSNTTCAITWTTGSTTSKGICMRNDDTFAASYVLEGQPGLVVYKMGENGTLQGLWTLAKNGGNGTEVLTPVSK